MTRVLVARVGSEYFAFPLTDVLEALDAPVVTPVPLTPKGVLGQFVHRGQLLPVLDPHTLLGAPLEAPLEPPPNATTDVWGATPLDTPLSAPTGAPAGHRGTVLVMVSDGAPFALAVDDVTDMVTVDAGARRALPEGADRTGMLAGLFTIDRMLVAAVDLTAFRATAGILLTKGT